MIGSIDNDSAHRQAERNYAGKEITLEKSELEINNERRKKEVTISFDTMCKVLDDKGLASASYNKILTEMGFKLLVWGKNPRLPG